jgi:hypothetical protein
VTLQNAYHMHTATTTPNVLDRSTRSQVGGGVAEKNSHCGITARLHRVFGAVKKKALMVLALLLALPMLALSQSDPLSPTYLPSIDTKAADYPSNIWITDTMQKVRQDKGAPGTQHWGTFYGTQNEFVDFQVHVQAPAGGIPDVAVIASNFVQSSPSSYTILASTANIIVYREAYMNVSPNVTATSSTYYGVTGYYPDILIPAVDPYYHQITNAWPFTVKASNNQSAWIDVHIPTTAPAGYYSGSITVKSGSATLATLPIIIGVWQWPSGGYMPSTSSLQSFTHMDYASACDQFLGGYANCGSYPGASAYATAHSLNPPDVGSELSIIDQAVLMLDHRYSAASVINVASGVTKPTAEFYNLWSPLFNGTATYNTSTILSGAQITSTALGVGGGATSPVAGNWATGINSQGWFNRWLNYSYDEPAQGDSAAWTTIANHAAVLHATTLKTPALITTWLTPATANSALNNVDIMVVGINVLDSQQFGGGNVRSTYDTWLAGNCCGAGSPKRQIWSYQACSDSGTCANGTVGSGITYPNYNIDGLPAANRAFEWVTFFNQESGELYNASTGAWGPGQDPWKSSSYFAGGWGDSNLLYPSTSGATNYVKQSDNTTALAKPIFLPSVRLKHIRDGMQDYEYLYRLTALGQGTYVNAQVTNWITNSYTFENTGKGLLGARIALGTALHHLSYSALILPPTNVTGKVQ